MKTTPPNANPGEEPIAIGGIADEQEPNPELSVLAERLKATRQDLRQIVAECPVACRATYYLRRDLSSSLAKLDDAIRWAIDCEDE